MGILFERKCVKKEKAIIKKKRKMALRQCPICDLSLPFLITVTEAQRLYRCSEKKLFKLSSEGKVDIRVREGRGRSLEHLVIVHGITLHEILRHA